MQRFKVTISEDAENDIDDAFVWYEIQKIGLGRSFFRFIKSGISNIKNNPFRYRIVHKNIRRLIISKFPYSVYYFVDSESSAIFIIAVLHSSRNPVVWKRRKRRSL